MDNGKTSKVSLWLAGLFLSLPLLAPSESRAAPIPEASKSPKLDYPFQRVINSIKLQYCFSLTGQPLRLELGTQNEDDCTSTVLDDFNRVDLSFVEPLSGLRENEVVVGARQLKASYCQYSSPGGGSQICLDIKTWMFSQRYPDGTYTMRYRAIEPSGKELVSAVTFQIANGLPSVTLGEARTPAIKSPGAKATAKITFQDIRATVATVELLQGKNKPIVVKVDLKDSTDGSGWAEFEGLTPASKYRFRIVTKNPNGVSQPFTGSFTTPEPPKASPSSRSSGGSASGPSGTCPNVVYVRLDRAESALRRAGCWPTSYEYPGCEALFGIVRKSNWVVVAQRGSELYACQN